MKAILLFLVYNGLATAEYLSIYNMTANMNNGQYYYNPRLLGELSLYNIEIINNQCNSKAVVHASGLLPTDSIVIKDEVTPEKDWVRSTGKEEEDLEMTVHPPWAYIIILTSQESVISMASITVTSKDCGGVGVVTEKMKSSTQKAAGSVTATAETSTKKSECSIFSVQVVNLICSIILFIM